MLDNIAIRGKIPGMILENIAKAMRDSGVSRYRISKDTGIDQAVLCRIATGSGNGSCGTKTADLLCKYLGLELVERKKQVRSKTTRTRKKERAG